MEKDQEGRIMDHPGANRKGENNVNRLETVEQQVKRSKDELIC